MEGSLQALLLRHPLIDTTGVGPCRLAAVAAVISDEKGSRESGLDDRKVVVAISPSERVTPSLFLSLLWFRCIQLPLLAIVVAVITRR